MWRWPWPGVGVGAFGTVSGSPPPPPPAPTPVTGKDEAKPVTPNLAYRPTSATTLPALVRDVNRIALSASQAATENPHWVMRHQRQIVVLDTGGLTTDSAVDMLHADSLVSHVTLRVTSAITGAVTTLTVGDSADPDRFVTGFTSFAAGSGAVGLAQWGAGTPHQSSDAALRVTADAAVTGGAVELIVWYWQFSVPSLPVATVSTPAPPSGTTTNGGLRLWGGRWLG